MGTRGLEEFVVEQYRVSIAMTRYGGSFVRNLGVALHCADNENATKIKETWPEYWQEYLKIFDDRIKKKDEDERTSWT